MKGRIGKWILAVGMAASCMAPVSISAQSIDSQIKRRQEKKNEWRNLGYIAGGAALWGLLKGDSTLVFAGAAGALYSAHRYEQDRKSQNKLNQTRARLFSQRSFTRNGQTYVRRTVKKNGKTFYQFVRK